MTGSSIDELRGKTLSQSFVLPWPPSINRYWRTVGKVLEGTRWVRKQRTLIAEQGRNYRDEAIIALRQQRVRAYERTERVAIRIEFYPPSRARRDLDNFAKAPLDVLTHGGILHDDEQIDDLRRVRREVSTTDPRLEVTIARLVDLDGTLAMLEELEDLANPLHRDRPGGHAPGPRSVARSRRAQELAHHIRVRLAGVHR